MDIMLIVVLIAYLSIERIIVCTLLILDAYTLRRQFWKSFLIPFYPIFRLLKDHYEELS